MMSKLKIEYEFELNLINNDICFFIEVFLF